METTAVAVDLTHQQCCLIVLLNTFVEVIRASLSYISLCVCMELWLYDSIEAGFAWPVISEIGKGSRWPRRLWIAVLRPDVLVKFPSLSIPAICAIRLMILPRHPSSKQASLNQVFPLGFSIACS